METRDGDRALAGAAARVSLHQKAIRSMRSNRCIRKRVQPANKSDQLHALSSIVVSYN